MKKLLFCLLIGFSLVWALPGNGKDGPFPMRESLGTWIDSNKKLQVEITISHLDDEQRPVLLIVARENKDGPEKRLIGSGLVTFVPNDRDPKLIVELKGENNEYATLILVPVFKANKDGGETLELSFSILKGGVENKNIPTTLVKIL